MSCTGRGAAGAPYAAAPQYLAPIPIAAPSVSVKLQFIIPSVLHNKNQSTQRTAHAPAAINQRSANPIHFNRVG